MMMKHEFPILEFDTEKDALIRPHRIIKPAEISKRCVMCFFKEAIEKVLNEFPHRVVGRFKAESLITPIYEVDYNGEKIVLVQAGVGAPIGAVQMEELVALGCRTFLACGSCGVLQKDIVLGHLIIPTSAVRDEGTSYHYVAPSREITADPEIVKIIAKVLTEKELPFIEGKTWTTDAFYRETSARIQRRREEGCITVDMEASAYMAVAQYNEVAFGQILYAGDNLGGEEWDSRHYIGRTDIRELVLRTALDVCLELDG